MRGRSSPSRQRHDFGARAPHGHRRRRGRVVGADADAARDPGRVGGRLEHEVTRAPIVNPHRRAVGAEQPVGAVAEDVQPRGQVQRRREAGAEFVEQRADVALQLVALAQAEQLERGHERVGRLRRVAVHARCQTAARRSRRRAGRRVPRRARAAAAAPLGRPAGRPDPASDERRPSRASARPARTPRRRGSLRPDAGSQGSVRSASRPKPDVACSAPLRGLCLNSSDAIRR